MNGECKLAALVMCSALLMTGCGREEISTQAVIRPVRAMKVGDVASLSERWFPGRAQAVQELNFSFRVAGPLIARPVNVGDRVKKGNILARIDPREFEVELRNVEGQRERAQAQLRRAQSEYKRELSILKEEPGATSQTAVDQKREAVERTRAELKSLEAAVDAAQDALSYTYLRAPYDGTIVATYVENYQDVKAKQPIVRLVDTSQIEMIVNVPENAISLAPYIHDIRVIFDAFPDREIPAKIKEIGTEASEATRTYPVTLVMDQPRDLKILPGMAGKASGQAELPDNEDSQIIEVPVTAVFSPEETNKSYIWIIDQKTQTVKRREVTPGELTNTGMRLKEGVKSGEWIVTAGVHFLHEGQQVRILQPR
jgi:RND family efflux transporter MFP subunit